VREVPLRVTSAQERTLLARLEAARQVYNACLGEARKRVRLVEQSKTFQHARTLSRDDPARKVSFQETDYAGGKIGTVQEQRYTVSGAVKWPIHAQAALSPIAQSRFN
jgi:hypothetical protein